MIDHWSSHGPTDDTSAPIAFAAGGSKSIRIDYYEGGGGATMRLEWLTPGASGYAVVPTTALFEPG